MWQPGLVGYGQPYSLRALSRRTDGDTVEPPTEEAPVTRPSLARSVRVIAGLLAVPGPAAARAAAAPAPTTYAALGDSYSSGVGTGSYSLDSACKRGVYAYPYLWTQRHAGTALSFAACSGAKTSVL